MQLRLPAFDQGQVVVVGDVMLDRYWQGATDRISPEAPVPVVHIKDQHARAGGAGNVALNIAALHSNATLVGLCGDDEAGQELQDTLTQARVEVCLEQLSGLPTITKLRVISLQQQLLRLDFEEKFYQHANEELLASTQQALKSAGALVISDYGKGTIDHPRPYIELARKAGVPVLVDPKGKEFERYRGATLLTPNLKEFEIVVGECLSEDDIVNKGLAAIAACELEALLVTRGSAGMTLIQPGKAPVHLPANAREVYDVTGAGDTVIGVIAASLAAGSSLEDATRIGNIAASITVGKLGAATVSIPELRRAISNLQANTKGVLSETELLTMVEDARAHGEKIVMTNGCFDILHAGHVSYLNNAKSHGDRLIVAVNDDDSVRRLKGAERPINGIGMRMEVLAGLGAVDWVVPFSEDTPQRIISEVLPDLLVKGGDYPDIEKIAGAKEVIANGGSVKALNFESDFSTSNIVDKIKDNK